MDSPALGITHDISDIVGKILKLKLFIRLTELGDRECRYDRQQHDH